MLTCCLIPPATFLFGFNIFGIKSTYNRYQINIPIGIKCNMVINFMNPYIIMQGLFTFLDGMKSYCEDSTEYLWV